jgi:hypothetical protein
LRQHLVVSDVAALAKYRAKGVEIIQLAESDVLAARPKALTVWRTATKGDALATKALDSQITLLKELGLLGA